jgi:hypothetical protein
MSLLFYNTNSPQKVPGSFWGELVSELLDCSLAPAFHGNINAICRTAPQNYYGEDHHGNGAAGHFILPP